MWQCARPSCMLPSALFLSPSTPHPPRERALVDCKAWSLRRRRFRRVQPIVSLVIVEAYGRACAPVDSRLCDESVDDHASAQQRSCLIFHNAGLPTSSFDVHPLYKQGTCGGFLYFSHQGALTSSSFRSLSFITPTSSHFLSLALAFSIMTNKKRIGHLLNSQTTQEWCYSHYYPNYFRKEKLIWVTWSHTDGSCHGRSHMTIN